MTVTTSQPRIGITSRLVKIFLSIPGVVSQISEDTIKPQTNAGNVNMFTASNQTGNAVGAFYEVTIKPETLALSREQHRCTIHLGMDGRADIITKEETLLQFLLRKAKLLADV